MQMGIVAELPIFLALKSIRQVISAIF